MNQGTPPFAVLFKTHFWDDFADRQFRRLCSQVKPENVFVVVDETNGPVHGIYHDKIVRMTEQASQAEGYLQFPAGRMFWYNTDYQVYHFFDMCHEYDYVFIVEYDCIINIPIASIVAEMDRRKLGFVGEKIREVSSRWHWRDRAILFYGEDFPFEGRLLCCAAFSRDFARQLQKSRRNHTKQVKDLLSDSPSEPFTWPNNEAFVGAEIARLGTATALLSEFGSTTHYDWAPPTLEALLPRLDQAGFIHPLLDSDRYIRSLRRMKWDLTEFFRPGSHLQRQLQTCDPTLIISMFLKHFVEISAWNAVEQLRQFAHDHVPIGAEELFNVAKGKPATQSSTSQWSRCFTTSGDASGAVNGRITGGSGFHTSYERDPWWMVDLQSLHHVREIRLFNRMDQRGRARCLVVHCSTNLVHWRELHKVNGQIFGGLDGLPLKIAFNEPLAMRFVRISLEEEQYLHLDEVQVFV